MNFPKCWPSKKFGCLLVAEMDSGPAAHHVRPAFPGCFERSTASSIADSVWRAEVEA
jgi:hypothetical protein